MSPHLQIWRWHATMLASTLHRLTGLSLFGGSFLIAGWVIALALGEEAYGFVEPIILSWYGQTILFLFTIAVLFHLANGIRYLAWDGPRIGFDPKVASNISILNIIIAVVGALALWAVVWIQGA